MSTDYLTIKLTAIQASHAIVALKEYSKKLLGDVEEEPIGGEHEDYLIIQSIIQKIGEANKLKPPT